MNEKTLLKAGYKPSKYYVSSHHPQKYYQKKLDEDTYITILKWVTLNKISYSAEIQIDKSLYGTFNVEILDCTTFSTQRVEKFFKKLINMKV